MFVVVAYDITNDRRRDRLMNLLKGYGLHAQESVFECDVSGPVYREMLARVQDTIDPQLDKVRLYHLRPPDVDRIVSLGVGPPVLHGQVFKMV